MNILSRIIPAAILCAIGILIFSTFQIITKKEVNDNHVIEMIK